MTLNELTEDEIHRLARTAIWTQPKGDNGFLYEGRLRHNLKLKVEIDPSRTELNSLELVHNRDEMTLDCSQMFMHEVFDIARKYVETRSVIYKANEAARELLR